MKSEELGKLFEDATHNILCEMFRRWGYEVLDSKSQKSGTQHGFDVYFRLARNHTKLNVFIECKASKSHNTIKSSELTQKIAQLEWAGFSEKDIHIFFSPSRAIDFDNETLTIEDDSYPFVILDWMRKEDALSPALELFASYMSDGGDREILDYCDYLFTEVYPGFKTVRLFDEVCHLLKHVFDSRISEHIAKNRHKDYRVISGAFWSQSQHETDEEHLHYYYTKTDSTPHRLRDVVANDYYVRNETLEREFERVLNSASKEQAALIKILSKGGEGKSTFLYHIAKTYYDSNVIIWLENTQPHILADIEKLLRRLVTDAPLIFLFDNASLAGNPLTEFAQKLTLSFRKRNFVLVIAEREFRYRNIEDVEDFEALFNEAHTINFRSARVREQVFDHLILLFPNSHTFSEEIRAGAQHAFLEDARKSLTERTFSVIKYLKLKDRLKGYKFDWDDWEDFSRNHAPKLKRLYLILATFYQFGFSLDIDFCASLLNGVDFVDINSALGENPNLPIYRRGRYLLLRHETLASWYLDASDEEKRINRRNSEEIFKLFLGQIKTDFSRNLFIRLCIKNKDFRQSYLAHYVDDSRRAAILDDFIKQHPTELKCRTELSKIYQKQKRWKEAEDILLELKNIDPDNLQARTELSKIYQKQKRWKEAEDILLESLKIDPEQLHPRTELSKIYQKQKRWNDAIRLLEEYIEIEPAGLHPRTELSKIYQKQKRWKEAEDILLELKNIDPDNLQARTELSKIYQKQKRWKEAEDILLELKNIDPDNLQARTELSKIYQKQKRWKEAEDILLESLKIDPEQLHPRMELSKIYQRQKRWKEAEDILLELLKLERDSLLARTELSRVYQNQGRLKEAEDILLECLKNDSDDLNSRTELSKLYQSQGKMSEAEDLLHQCLSINASDPNSLLELGKIRSKDPANYAAAEQLFQRILDTDPDNLFAKVELASLYRKMARWYEREQILFGIYETHPEDIPTLTALAQVFLRFKKYRIAVRLLESALELRKSDLRTVSELIRLHLVLRDKDSVIRYLKRGEEILSRDPYNKHKERFGRIIVEMDEEISLLGLNQVGVLAGDGEELHVQSEGMDYPLTKWATVNYKARAGDKVFFAIYRRDGQVFADFVEPFFENIDHLEELK